MEPTAARRSQCEEDGFPIFPRPFSPREVAILRGEVERVTTQDSELILREEAGGPAKTIFRMHRTDG